MTIAAATPGAAELYHLIAEGIPNMVWTARPDGGLDFFNRRVFDYTGLTSDELREWGWRNVIHPSDWPMCEARWRRSLDTGESYEIEFRLRRADGSYRWHIGAALPLRDAGGAIARWFGTCTDIEEEKRANNARYRALVEFSPDAIIIRHGDAFAYANDAALRLLRVQRVDDLLGKSIYDLVHPDDLAFARRRQVRHDDHGEALPPAELRLRRSDGSYVAVEAMAATMEFEGRKAALAIWRDLTARERSDHARRESEAALKEAQRLAHLGSWEANLVTGLVKWSEEMFRIFGLDPAAGPPPMSAHSKLYTPESWERVHRMVAQTLATNEPYAIELEAVRPDGTTLWTLARGEVVHQGGMLGLRGTVQDISDLRRAEHALRKSEQRFQAFMDNTPAVAWIKDSKLRWVYVSPPYESALGKLSGEILGLDDFEIWPEAVARRLRQTDLEVIRSQAPLTVVQQLPDAQGADTYWLSVKFPLPDETGANGIGGMAIDVTERQRLEQALRDSEAQMSLAMQTAQIAHWSWAPESGMHYSEGMGALFGRERGVQFPRARDWLKVVHPDDRDNLLAAARASYASGELLQVDWRLLKPDGSVAWMSSRAQTQKRLEGAVRMVGITMDITQRRAAQAELEEYSERVKQLLYRLVETQESERRNLASSLHDLIGQKLTALNIGLDILKRDLHATAGPLVRERLDSMAVIVDETVDAIRGVMDDLHPSELEDFGLVPALHSHAKRFEANTGIRTAVDAVEPDSRLPPNVELALFRVVQEALTNVIKHSGASSIRIGAWEAAGRAFVSIDDNGRGFLDPAGARLARRGGWGLPEMRKRAEAVGGQLKIEFPDKGGTRVLVDVPACNAD